MAGDAEVAIREAGTDDAAIIAGILRESFRGQAALMGLNPEDFPNFNEFLDEATVRKAIGNGNVLFMLFAGDVPIGTIWYRLDKDERDVGHVRKLAVLPPYRGRGYGERLMQFAEEQLKALGACRARLMYNASFPKLQAYYECLGYTFTKREQFETLPFEVVTMEKSLST